MFHISKIAHLGAVVTICSVLTLPSFAQDTTNRTITQMSGKTMSKAAADKMMVRKMMSGLTAAERRTYAAMTPAEKALCLKMCWRVSGGQLSSKLNNIKTPATR